MQPKKCAECGAEFTPKIPNQKYCSKQCSRNAYAWRSRRSYEAREAEHALDDSEDCSTAATNLILSIL